MPQAPAGVGDCKALAPEALRDFAVAGNAAVHLGAGLVLGQIHAPQESDADKKRTAALCCEDGAAAAGLVFGAERRCGAVATGPVFGVTAGSRVRPAYQHSFVCVQSQRLPGRAQISRRAVTRGPLSTHTHRCHQMCMADSAGGWQHWSSSCLQSRSRESVPQQNAQ